MTPRQRRTGVPLAIALLVPLVVFAAPPAALGSSIDDKRAEAVRIQAQVDVQAERIADLDRQLDAARAKADEATAAVNRARAELADADRGMAEASARLRTQAVDAYVQGNSVSVFEHLSNSDGTDIPVRNQYVKAVSAEHAEALEALKVARQDLMLKRARDEDAQRSAQLALSLLNERLAELAQGESAQRANLARVNGELAQLLQAEQARLSALALQRSQSEARPGRRPAARVGGSHASPGGMWACIRQLESNNNYRTPEGGAYQFKNGTWEDMGGTGKPEDADPATQDAMAMKLYQQRGWQPWVTAPRCGAS